MSAVADLEAGISLGIYEKALRSGPLAVSGNRVDGEAWRVFLDQVPHAGFSFLDLSIDESPEREARLDWDRARRGIVRRAVETVGTAIGGLCLSVHRKIGPGSADPGVRERARDEGGRDLVALIEELTDLMHEAASSLKFELAARYRDEIKGLKSELWHSQQAQK